METEYGLFARCRFCETLHLIYLPKTVVSDDLLKKLRQLEEEGKLFVECDECTELILENSDINRDEVEKIKKKPMWQGWKNIEV